MISLTGTAVGSIDRSDPRYLALCELHNRLVKKDATIWGRQAALGAGERLNWIDLPESSRQLLPQLDALSAKHRDKTRIILCGMGGSSLGPEVIARSSNAELFILDSTDPNYIEHAIDIDLSNVLVIVSSKSGTTIETASQRAFFEKAFTDAQLRPQEHMIFVTDPDSFLDESARSEGYYVVNADPHVGGRFSVLSAFGLVPAALIGVDASVLLDNASATKAAFFSDPRLVVDLAYAISYLAGQYISFSDNQSDMPGLSDWIEQLVAESTGKSQLGRLPIVEESPNKSIFSVAYAGEADLVVGADLASQFIIWEWVIALVGAALGVDPFNQPNVTEAKDATSRLLTKWAGVPPTLSANAVDGAVEIFGAGATLEFSLAEIIKLIPEGGYLAVMAYLDRQDNAGLQKIRSLLAQKTGRPVTFGWGPRFLHSTGQFHKGGQPNGAFLQITGEVKRDYEIPGQVFGFKTLLSAQVLGDGQALASRDFPLLRLNLKERNAGIEKILAAIKSL